MFCPECQAEYRQGFTRCADCDVDLVYALPRESRTLPRPGAPDFDSWESERRLIWKGHNEADCVALCRQLMKADIPYKVGQIPEERDRKMGVIWRYEIGVLDEDSEKAKELLGIEGPFADACDGPDDETRGEMAEDARSLPADDYPPDKPIRNEAFLKHWYPEDATIEIWAQDADDISSGIQMALKENQIHCLVGVRNAISRVFVTPEDEPRARQIVREIIEDIGPE